MKKQLTFVGFGTLPLFMSGCLLFLFGGFEGCVNPMTGEVYINVRAEIKQCESYDSESSSGKMVFCSNGVLPFESSPTLFDSSFEVVGTGDPFLDPVVMQVPSDATGFMALLEKAPDPAVPALIQSGLTCVDTTPGEQLCAEPGHQLVIFDIPPNTPLGLYQIQIVFNVDPPREIEVKPVVTGKVQSGGKTFYPVVVPCVSDMADAPGVTIPMGMGSALPLTLPDLSGVQACNGLLEFSPSASTMAPAASPVGLVLLAVAGLALGVTRLRKR